MTVVSTPLCLPPLTVRVKSFLRGRGWPRPARTSASHLDDVAVEHYRIERFRPINDGDLPDADVVIATWWETAEWVAALSPAKGAKAHFIQGHEVDLPGQPAARVAATWRLPLHRILCSRWLVELARTQYGDALTSYVPCGIDTFRFSVPPRVKQQRPTAGMVYADQQIKGCDIALAAFARAAKRIPGLRLVAFGSVTPGEALPLPSEAEFIWRPAQQLIPQLYARCDAWLWPSRREGFGLPILEAMACRTPVIATPAGAAPELLSGGGGVLVPPEDPESFAAAIEKVCGLSDSEWRAMSDRARTVASSHTWEHSVPLFEAALELAIQRTSELRKASATRLEGLSA